VTGSLMTCEEAQRRWHRRFDDGTSDAELEAHLGSCGGCRGYAAKMDRLAAVLRELRMETEAIASRPLAVRSDRVRRVSRHPFPLLPWVKVAAMFAIVAGGALFYLKLDQRRHQPSISKVAVAPNAMNDEQDGVLGLTLRGESIGRFVVATSAPESNVQVYWFYPSFKGETR